jgi:Mg-chelatase subunit ChlI
VSVLSCIALPANDLALPPTPLRLPVDLRCILQRCAAVRDSACAESPDRRMQLINTLPAAYRVSEQTRNEIRHVVDLCNDHAPIRQVRTSQSRQPSQPQQQPTRHQPHATQQHHHHQQQHQGRPQQQRIAQPQPSPQQVQQHRQVAAAAAAAASAQRAQVQQQAQFHSPDMQRLLAFGQRESPQQGYRIASA